MTYMTFPEFQASRVEVADCSDVIGFDYGDNRVIPGFTYADNMLYIERRLGTGNFYLLLGNSDWLDPDLTKLERILWANWYLGEVESGIVLNTDDGTLDDFVVGWCDAHGLSVDGDYFGLVFAGLKSWPLHSTKAELERWAHETGVAKYNRRVAEHLAGAQGDSAVSDIHAFYKKLTDDEREYVDAVMSNAYTIAATHDVPLAGDDRIERATDAFARAVIESRVAS